MTCKIIIEQNSKLFTYTATKIEETEKFIIIYDVKGTKRKVPISRIVEVIYDD